MRSELLATEHHDVVIGIDATNLVSGGAVLHLTELLNAADRRRHNFSKIIVWGAKELLTKLPNKPWLEKISPLQLNCNLLVRLFWQRFMFPKAAAGANCDVVFVPSGLASNGFHPVVTMSQNLLPFEFSELKRYGCSIATIRLLAIRYLQNRSFRRSDGVVFLTKYAQRVVESSARTLRCPTAIIPHGLDSVFVSHPRSQKPIEAYTGAVPLRVLYVSTIDKYKHQERVVEAVSQLRCEGYPIQLDLVGPAYPPSLKSLRDVISQHDPDGCWVNWLSEIAHEKMSGIYKNAEIGIFASSCENLPNILLEKMASGLPIVCSKRGPMPEVLGASGLYFDPENVKEIAQAIRRYLLSPELRLLKANSGFEQSKQFSWLRCADETFKFLNEVLRKSER